MGRVLAILLLSISFTALAQTTTPAKTSDSIPARVNLDPAPAVVPGSSTPINILVPSSIPGQTPPVTETEPVASVSVADAAVRYRSQKGSLNSRRIDNSTLMNLSDTNPSGLRNAGQIHLPESDMGAEAETVYGSRIPEHAAVGEVLDTRDLSAVEALVARSQPQPVSVGATETDDTQNTEISAGEELAAVRYDQMVAEAEQASSAQQSRETSNTAATDEQTAEYDERGDQLPETAGMLPFIALLGALTLAGGGVAVARARA